MQYIKVENSGYVNQVQADPRIIYDNHGQAYQVQTDQNHGYINQVQTDPRDHGYIHQVQTDPRNHGYIHQIQTDPRHHGYITQVQTGPDSYHGFDNQVQENHGYINQDETDPLHGFITQVQTGPNSYHGYINHVQENPGYFNRVQTENHDNVSHDQTGSNHGWINQVQTGPTKAARPEMLEHHPILKPDEAEPVPSKDLQAFHRLNPKIKMENHAYNNQDQTENPGSVDSVQTGPNHGCINQVQTGPTGAAESEMPTHHQILQAVEAKSVPSRDLHNFRRPKPRVKIENQGYNNQIQTGPTGTVEPEILKHHPILKPVLAKPVPPKDFHTFRHPYPRGKFGHQGM